MDYPNQNTKYCILKGHEENKASYIWIYKNGEQTQQWLCGVCILQYFDNNGHPLLNHNMKKKLFLDYIKQQTKPIYDQCNEKKEPIQICILVLQQFIKSTESLIQELVEYLRTIDEYYNVKEMQKISNITEEDHNLLTNKQIDQLINLNNCNKKKFDYNLSSDLLKQLNQQYIELQKLLQNNIYNNQQNNLVNKQEDTVIMQDIGNQNQRVIQQTINQKNDSNKVINQKDRKQYIIQEIDQTNTNFNASSISKNEQYLAYGGDDKLLKIYGIKQKMIIKEIKFDKWIFVCQFTQDSLQLYVGLNGGYVCGYDVKDDFKEIYKQQIHSLCINNIITIQNDYLITCSDDKSIIKTKIKSKQQIFILTGHTQFITAIDYNDKDEIIVSGSYDRSIKLWNCRNQSIIINKEQSHNRIIRSIQLINNNLNILSLDFDGNLYKWKIDLTNKVLIKLQQFSDQHFIFNFYSVNQDQNLLLICQDYATILNQQGETINTIEHGGKNSLQFQCRQLDNLKYILIRAKYKIILAIAQD